MASRHCPAVPGAFPVLPARGCSQTGQPGRSRVAAHGGCVIGPATGAGLGTGQGWDGTIRVPGTDGKQHQQNPPGAVIRGFWSALRFPAARVPAGSRGRECCVTLGCPLCTLPTPGDDLGVLHSFISTPPGSCHLPPVSSANVSCCWQLTYFHSSQDLGHSFVSGF